MIKPTAFSLRLPPELHRRVKVSAALAGVSRNTFILSLLDAGSVSAEALDRIQEAAPG